MEGLKSKDLVRRLSALERQPQHVVNNNNNNNNNNNHNYNNSNYNSNNNNGFCNVVSELLQRRQRKWFRVREGDSRESVAFGRELSVGGWEEGGRRRRKKGEKKAGRRGSTNRHR